ncbi:hypothetical protein AMTRI_Chr13g116590 [Amborella trichopoda]
MDSEPLSLTLSLSPYQPSPTTIHPLFSSLSLPLYQDNGTISTTLLSLPQQDSSHPSLISYSSTSKQYSANHAQDLEDVAEHSFVTRDFGNGHTKDLQNSSNHVQDFSNCHRCNLCSKSFTSGQALGGHRTIHREVLSKMNSKEKKRERNGERFYECRVCRKGFKSSQALGGHMGAHRLPTEGSSSKSFLVFL